MQSGLNADMGGSSQRNEFRFWYLLQMFIQMLLVNVCLAGEPYFPAFAHVVDEGQTLSEAERSALRQRLVAFREHVGSEVAIVILSSLSGQELAAYSNELANHWKLGRKGVGDGVLIVLVPGERQARIEVAKALEGAIPDAVAKRILAEQMSPLFARQAYAEGLNAGLTAIFERVEAEGLSKPVASSATERGSGYVIAMLMATVSILLGGLLFLAARTGFEVAGSWSRFLAPPLGLVIAFMQSSGIAQIIWVIDVPALITAFVLLGILGSSSYFYTRYFWRLAIRPAEKQNKGLARKPKKFSKDRRLPSLSESESSRGSTSGSISSSNGEPSEKPPSGGGDFGGGGASDKW